MESEPQKKASHFPLRVAAIDIGSNAVRFLAVELTGPETIRVLKTERHPVRLAHDTFSTGCMAEDTMNSAIAGLISFRRQMNELEIQYYRAVSTSAVRESKNRDEFIRRARSEANLSLEIISGSEEIRLVHLSVSRKFSLGKKQWILVDLGGGSVEIALVDRTGILWTESHNMGAVRLLEELTESGKEPDCYAELLEEYISTIRVPSVSSAKKPAGMIATGGNIGVLADMSCSISGEAAIGKGGPSSGIRVLPVKSLRVIIDTLSSLSYDKRVSELKLEKDRADVILPAAIVFERLARLIETDRIIIPAAGVQEGLILDMALDMARDIADHRQVQDKQFLGSALALGRKYMFDQSHAEHVLNLAVSLFDQLADLHELDNRARRLLAISAILHDIGRYISYKQHHKHSLYLISQSELPGFSPDEMMIIANTARYHRKRSPGSAYSILSGSSHAMFMGLPAGDREIVRKLAAILRLADAMDREHLQKVSSVRVELVLDKARLILKGTGDMLLELWALQKKSKFFEDYFNLKVEVVVERCFRYGEYFRKIDRG